MLQRAPRGTENCAQERPKPPQNDQKCSQTPADAENHDFLKVDVLLRKNLGFWGRRRPTIDQMWTPNAPVSHKVHKMQIFQPSGVPELLRQSIYDALEGQSGPQLFPKAPSGAHRAPPGPPGFLGGYSEGICSWGFETLGPSKMRASPR